MQEQTEAFVVAVLVEMVDLIGVEQAGAALDAVDEVAFLDQELVRQYRRETPLKKLNGALISPSQSALKEMKPSCLP